MVKLTLLARISDGLPLAEGLDDAQQELEQWRRQAKTLIKNMSSEGAQASRMSVESGQFVFHYIIEGQVCYLTLTDKSYPKKLAYQYLEDLHNEFATQYGSQVGAAARPYAFIKFDTFIQRTKKLYLDTRTQRNINKLSEDLVEVHSIMTKNIQDVLGQGEALNRMSQMGAELQAESAKYASKAKDLYRQALIRKYTPIAAIAGLVILFLYFRWQFY